MPNNNIRLNRYLPDTLLLLFAGIFVMAYYGKMLSAPNDYLFSDSGDGIKNYFTYAYHIKNNSTIIHFDGMNYPYGEHFLYTDCHPVITVAMKLLAGVSGFPENYSIGLLNFLLIFSIFLTFWVCYLLLNALKIEKWLSLVFAISMAVMAPQIFRLGGHYALSYSVAIPLSWFLLTKVFSSSKSYSLLLFLNLLFWMFIHAYLGIIAGSFLFTMLVLSLLLKPASGNEKRRILSGMLAVALPVLIFYGFTIISDPFDGRTDNPSGFFLYNAEFDDVFVPHHPPLRPLLDKLTGGVIKLKWEAWSYVGFAGTIIFLALLISLFYAAAKSSYRKNVAHYFNNRNINIPVIAACILLLFAMGFPFKQFPALIDYFPVFKQFRATGRFAWPFFFAFGVLIANILQQFIGRKRNFWSYALIPVLVLIFNIAEGLPYHREVSGMISKSKNYFNSGQLTEEYRKAISSIQPENYQAILTLPFYYYGSESYERPRSDQAMKVSMIISYHTGIPNICANLTRTPVYQSKNIVQILSPGFYPKNFVSDFPSEKPFLVVVADDHLTGYEEKILLRSKRLADFEQFSMYEITFDALFQNDAEQYIREFYTKKDKLYESSGFLVSDNAAFLYFDDFENMASTEPFRGSGGYRGMKKGKNTYCEIVPGNFDPGITYSFSIWMNNREKDALNLWFRFLVEEWNPKTDLWTTSTVFPEQSEVIYGDWSLVEGEFSVQSSESYVYFVSKGKEDSKAELFADDLLIREKHVDVYRLDTNSLFYNNHKISFQNHQ